jgi:uncharacterized membrane protein
MRERGSTTIWMLGLSLLLLSFGGLALDFWRGLALQRELAAVADSAAIAGASGIDEILYRSSGEVVLDPVRARDMALASIDFQGVTLTSVEVVVDPGGSTVSVSIRAALDLGLLGVFIDDDSPLVVGASAVAGPQRVP